MEEWRLLSEETPGHQNLVLCWDGRNTLPAIYYNNHSFLGFYFFNTYYHSHDITIYSKVRLKPKHEITNVIKWKLIEDPETEEKI